MLDRPEQQVIENVFELDTRIISSAMTPRDRVAWFDLRDTDQVVRMRIAAEPFSTYPVCDGSLDRVLGYVDQRPVPARAQSTAHCAE